MPGRVAEGGRRAHRGALSRCGRAVAVAVAVMVVVSCSSRRTPRLLAEGAPVQPSFLVELPARRSQGLLVVPIRVGDQDLEFLLDSGAPTAITPALQRQLGLTVRARTEAADARRTRTKVDVVRLPRVSLAGVGFDDVAAVVLDLQAVPEIRCLGVSGLLGANLMRQAAWQIDVEAPRIRIADDVAKLGTTEGIPSARFITLDSGSPVLRPILDEVPVPDMVLDTGADVGLVAPTTALVPDPDGTRPMVAAVGTSGAAALGYGSLTGMARFVRVERIRLGDLRVAGTVVEFRDESSLLGTRFLRNYLVTLDWRRRTVWLAPKAGPVREPPAGFGFDVLLRDGTMVVARVLVDSPAWEAGVRPGHEVVAIDGGSTSPLSLERYCRYRREGLAPPEAGSLRVTFRDQERERTVALRRFAALVGS